MRTGSGTRSRAACVTGRSRARPQTQTLQRWRSSHSTARSPRCRHSQLRPQLLNACASRPTRSYRRSVPVRREMTNSNNSGLKSLLSNKRIIIHLLHTIVGLIYPIASHWVWATGGWLKAGMQITIGGQLQTVVFQVMHLKNIIQKKFNSFFI